MLTIRKLVYVFYLEIPMFSLYGGKARFAVEDAGDGIQVRKEVDNIRRKQSRLTDKEGFSKFRSGTNRISPHKQATDMLLKDARGVRQRQAIEYS
jgi:hypothetical protein